MSSWTFKEGFAEVRRLYEGSQESVSPISESVIKEGFIPQTVLRKGHSLPANWLNFLFRYIFRLFNRDVVTDSLGVGLFKNPDSFLELTAFDKDDPTKFIRAIGWKTGNTTHSLNVISSNTLTLGIATVDGTQPVNGGSNVVILGKSRN